MEWYKTKIAHAYRNGITDEVKNYIFAHVDGVWANVAMIVVGIIFLVAALYLIDVILKKNFLYFIKKLINFTNSKWSVAFYDNRVFNSIIHFFSIAIARVLMPYVFYPLPGVVTFLDRTFYVLLIMVFIQMFNRIADAVSEVSVDENNYRTVAVRSFSQLIKIITTFFGVLAFISIMFNIGYAEILGTMGALTAILILVFRDTILGFVSGIQIASTQMVKVGDWVSIPKYSIEGKIKEINLVSAKILNFDKTISSVPTYDLISTEVRNFEPMVHSKTRRIKRAILFNVKSFKFCTPEMLERFKQINLIEAYISKRQVELREYNQSRGYNPNNIVNGINLTNIGVFREYTKCYLLDNPNISHSADDFLMVRQLEATPQGLPLEIFCFTNTSAWVEYEKIQSDVFDHLLSACKEFDLEVVQILAS